MSHGPQKGAAPLEDTSAGDEAADGDPRATPVVPADKLAAVFASNHRQLLGFLERRIGNRAVAEDLLQDAFMKGLGTVTGEEDASILAWFYRSLRNAIVDHHRRKGASERALASFSAELESLENGTSHEVELRSEICKCVRELAQTLRPAYAEALERVEIAGVSVKDYAREAGISSSNAGVRIFRAREALKQQLVRSCGTCAEHGCEDCRCGAGAGRSAGTSPGPAAP